MNRLRFSPNVPQVIASWPVDELTGHPEIRFYRATGKYGFLSNLFPCLLLFEDRVFPTAEHAYQFGKPKDPAVAEWIVLAPKPHLVAAAAHALFVFDVNPEWSRMKVNRMRSILRAKFSPAGLRAALLETGNATLVEASNTDSFWGVGKKGNGKNILGELLMEIRREIGPWESEDTA